MNLTSCFLKVINIKKLRVVGINVQVFRSKIVCTNRNYHVYNSAGSSLQLKIQLIWVGNVGDEEAWSHQEAPVSLFNFLIARWSRKCLLLHLAAICNSKIKINSKYTYTDLQSIFYCTSNKFSFLIIGNCTS